MTWLELAPVLDTGRFGTWSQLVGVGWPVVARVLHPAYRVMGDHTVPVPWRDLGSDIAPQASWYDLTGQRLHSGRTGAGWEAEPTVGPLDSSVTIPLLRQLGATQEEHLYVAEWDGYGNGGTAGKVKLGDREWVVHELNDSDQIQTWLDGLGTDTGPLPSLAWPGSLRWVLNADVDLPCTVVGCGQHELAAIQASKELEVVVADPLSTIVM